MKLDFIVISALLVMLVILPFVLLPLIQKGGNKKRQKKFLKEATGRNLNINIQESWNQNIFGIDSFQKKIILVRSIDESFQIEMVDLCRVKQSGVKVTNIPLNRGGKKEEHLQKVDLEFLLFSPEEKILLNLYHYDINYTQDMEIKNAEKCNSHIQSIITSQTYLQVPA